MLLQRVQLAGSDLVTFDRVRLGVKCAHVVDEPAGYRGRRYRQAARQLQPPSLLTSFGRSFQSRLTEPVGVCGTLSGGTGRPAVVSLRWRSRSGLTADGPCEQAPRRRLIASVKPLPLFLETRSAKFHCVGPRAALTRWASPLAQERSAQLWAEGRTSAFRTRP
jgi:hypothetical protein